MSQIRIQAKTIFNPFLYRLLLPISALLTLTGYCRPWVSHQAAGLVILGLDLGELVKLLYPVQQGDIILWRDGFYLPLVAVSVSLSLNTFRRDQAYGWPVRIGMLLLATVAALNLLPPAWSPGVLAMPEFHGQVGALLLCLILAGFSPFAALLAAPLRGLFSVGLAAAAIYFPLAQFQWILPTLADLYGQPVATGWGPTLMTVGLLGLLLYGLADMGAGLIQFTGSNSAIQPLHADRK